MTIVPCIVILNTSFIYDDDTAEHTRTIHEPSSTAAAAAAASSSHHEASSREGKGKGGCRREVVIELNVYDGTYCFTC